MNHVQIGPKLEANRPAAETGAHCKPLAGDLSSLGSRLPRSRSPIVDQADGLGARISGSTLDRDSCELDLRPAVRRSIGSAQSPGCFELSASPLDGLASLGRRSIGAEEASSGQLAERRRSLFECSPATRTAQVQLGSRRNASARSQLHCDQCELQQTGASSARGAAGPLDSLDRILAHLEESSSQLGADNKGGQQLGRRRAASRERASLAPTDSASSFEWRLGGEEKEEEEEEVKVKEVKEEVKTGEQGERGVEEKEDVERRQKALKHEQATGFEIAWLDFTYTVGPSLLEDPRWGRINKVLHKERRTILKGLSGGLRSGQMVALMGPSGAGKTCLLESISGVRTSGIGGRMCLRGRKRLELVIVPQYDNFMPQFTVEETIVYGSRMKNGPSTNHRQAARQVIEQLGLEACRSNNIQRCSGGQRKRAAVAQELVSRPNVLVLDEPTSGLDSSCCYQTMKVLRAVLDQSVQTDEPMSIVCTIHQPSAKVFQMFDSVYLLGKTGHTAYSGPPRDLVPTISAVTGLECPKYSNPSDFIIELVAYDYGEEPVQRLIENEHIKGARFKRDFERRANLKPSTKVETLNNKNNNSTSRPANELEQTATGHLEYEQNVTVPLRRATSAGQRSHPFLWHTWWHIHRSFLQAIRDPILNNMRILIHLGFASLLVLLYGKKSGEARGCPPVLGLPQEITDPHHESMIDLADNVGYLFMCIMMITYVSLMSTVLTFPIDIKTVGKEYKNGWYGTVTYFLGKTIADLPFIIVYPVVYCLITWNMTNQAQDSFWRYLSFNGLIIMNAMNSQSFGLILGALFVNSVTAATFLGPVITIPWYLFTGFTKRIHRLSEPFHTTSKFLFTRYVFEGILDTVYGHERCNCSKFLDEYQQLRYEEASRLGQLISMEALSSLDYYDGLETVADVVNETLFPPEKSAKKWFERTVDAASTVFANGDDGLNLASLMDTNVKASSLFSFGLDFEPTCPKDYDSFVVQDFKIGEDNVQKAFLVVFGMLCIIRILTFVLVAWKIRTRQL